MNSKWRKSAGDADVRRVLDIILSYSVIAGVRLPLVRILHAIIPCDVAHHALTPTPTYARAYAREVGGFRGVTFAHSPYAELTCRCEGGCERFIRIVLCSTP